MLYPGTQQQVITETTSQPNTTTREVSVLSDTVLTSLYVTSVTSGTLQVNIYTLTDVGKEVLLYSYPLLSVGTTDLLLRRASVCLQRVRIEAIYTGVCSYEIYARAISGGLSDARIIGSTNWETDQITVGTSPIILIPAVLTDRNGVVIKNWSTTQNIFVAESSAKLVANKGYPLAGRDGLALDIAAGAAIWIVSDSPGADVRIAQSGG